MRRTLSIGLAVTLVLTACSGPQSSALAYELEGVEADRIGDWTAIWSDGGGLQRFAWTEGDRLLVDTVGGRRNFIAGVNVGATVPGHFPGEVAVPAETYWRWFSQMSDFGFTAIRIYTMLPPHFYRELRAHNLANPRRPLYLIHGAWPPEEQLLEGRDFHDPTIVAAFEQELTDLVDVVHGEASISERKGRAYGEYTADVSPWLIAWAIGIEWDPQLVAESDQANAGLAPFSGTYFSASDDASATESWLASMLDVVARSEAGYGVTMPLAFVNWTTTDPLHHPDEPNDDEDRVTIDPSHLSPTDAWPGGYFAGYHLYPYYPDFQRFEDGVADYQRNGTDDAYAGLLTKIKAHHADLPVVVLELGVPSGPGKAHDGPQDRDQGDHTEQQQASINAELLTIAHETGTAGGMLFAWSDEWFKLTWNTMAFEIPERRALWLNPWTNESQFGVIASEPGSRQRIVLDGDGSDWQGESQAVVESRGSIRELRVTHDEAYVYLRVVTDEAKAWHRTPLVIGFDTLAGASGGLPHSAGAGGESDYAVVLDGDEARLLVRASADPLLLEYAPLGYVTPEPDSMIEGNGKWNLYRLMTNRPQTVPSTGARQPVEVFDVGRLVHGTTDPTDARHDSRSSWYAAGTSVEIRLPWQALGFADPSTHQVYVVDQTGSFSYAETDEIGIVVHLGGETFTTAGYRWSPWNLATYHERLKVGSAVLAETVIDLNSR